MHGDGKQAPGEMPWIVPARKLQLLGFGHILPWVLVGSGLPPSAQTRRTEAENTETRFASKRVAFDPKTDTRRVGLMYVKG
jgi:hypothetical protein